MGPTQPGIGVQSPPSPGQWPPPAAASQPGFARWGSRAAAAMVDAFVLVVVPSAAVVALPWLAYGAGIDVGGG